MQTTEPTNQKFKALAVKATEIKQSSDHCSGQSETWSEVDFDAFARMLVEECVGVIEHHCAESERGLVGANSLKTALRAHFGLV
jgi:hypothetical protein